MVRPTSCRAVHLFRVISGQKCKLLSEARMLMLGVLGHALRKFKNNPLRVNLKAFQGHSHACYIMQPCMTNCSHAAMHDQLQPCMTSHAVMQPLCSHAAMHDQLNTIAIVIV